MKALPFVAIGLCTVAAGLSIFGLVWRMRDRDEMREKFIQYLPGYKA